MIGLKIPSFLGLNTNLFMGREKMNLKHGEGGGEGIDRIAQYIPL